MMNNIISRIVLLGFILLLFFSQDGQAETFFKFHVARNSYSLGTVSMSTADNSVEEIVAGITTFELGGEVIIYNQYAIYLGSQSISYSSEKTEFGGSSVQMNISSAPLVLIFKGYFFDLTASNHHVYFGLGQTTQNQTVTVNSLDTDVELSYSAKLSFSTIDIGFGYDYAVGNVVLGLKVFLMEGTKTKNISDEAGEVYTFKNVTNTTYFGLNLGLFF